MQARDRDTTLPVLLEEIRACRVCADLPEGPRPVVAAAAGARIVIIGQAPGRRVHQSGVAWDDASGDRLRDWLGVSRAEFDDPEVFALVPMGFCYPGTGRSGDLPPRPECAPLWHERLLARLPRIELTVLLSRYAHDRYLGDRKRRTLTESVRAFRDELVAGAAPSVVPLPHPSPRNNRWLARNRWLETDVLPWLRRRVAELVAADPVDPTD
ncbi:MAG: uracil-DNA glycosylase family protein [Acidobacteriota bacterium]